MFAGVIEAPEKSIVGTNPFSEIVAGNVAVKEEPFSTPVTSSVRPVLSAALNLTVFIFFSDDNGMPGPDESFFEQPVRIQKNDPMDTSKKYFITLFCIVFVEIKLTKLA